MNPLLIGPLFEIAGKVFDRLLPDDEQKAQAHLELVKLQQNGELAKLASDERLSLGQVEINKIEAQSEQLFKSGWRPFIGWVCGAGLVYEFVLRPFIPLFCSLFLVTCPEMISLDNVLMELMFGMLGLGAMRTLEKKR